MVGTINLSLTQQLDEFGEPLAGGQLYFIQAGTVSTPQNAYQDTGLTIPMPNPITLDAAGRIPQFFLADGLIKVRLQDVNGVVKFVADNLQVIGPSVGGGGGGGSVDPTTVLSTGDLKARYDNAILTGWVRLNAKTIGSASSGATEFADATAQALFNFLWLKDATLTVTPGGRGASAAADWTANKQITLPDGRNRLLMALADMGNTALTTLSGAVFSGTGNATTLGSLAGDAATPTVTATLATANLPPYTPSGTNASSSVSVSNTGEWAFTNAGGSTVGGGAVPIGTAIATLSATGTAAAQTFTGAAQGGTSAAIPICPPVMLITVYIKL